MDSILLELAVQRFAIDAQQTCSGCPVASGRPQRARDMIAFDFGERQGTFRLEVRGPDPHHGGKVADADRAAAAEDQRALDGVLELADVAGPAVLPQRLEGFEREGATFSAQARAVL